MTPCTTSTSTWALTRALTISGYIWTRETWSHEFISFFLSLLFKGDSADGIRTAEMLRNATRDWWEQAHNSYELKAASSLTGSSSSIFLNQELDYILYPFLLQLPLLEVPVSSSSFPLNQDWFESRKWSGALCAWQDIQNMSVNENWLMRILRSVRLNENWSY
jgi:hypothetical protein